MYQLSAATTTTQTFFSFLTLFRCMEEGQDDVEFVSRGDEGYIYVKAGCHKLVTNML